MCSWFIIEIIFLIVALFLLGWTCIVRNSLATSLGLSYNEGMIGSYQIITSLSVNDDE